MEAVVMKNLGIVLIIVSGSSVTNGKAVGHVIPQQSALQLKSDINNNIEVYRDNGDGSSWLHMLFVFARDSSNSQSTSIIGTKSEKSTDCNYGFIQLESRKCYYFSIKKLSFYNASKVCETMDATLAHPLNGIENTAIVHHLLTNFTGTQGWWLGGSDEAKEGEWVWTRNKDRIIYTDWMPGQPSNRQPEHCLHYWIASEIWQWEDVGCNYDYPFICQQ